jgi:hypothetical protein
MLAVRETSDVLRDHDGPGDLLNRWCVGPRRGLVLKRPSPLQTSEANKCAVNEGANGRLIIVGQREADGTPCADDGFVFVRCPECFGTRKKETTTEQKLEQLRKDFGI